MQIEFLSLQDEDDVLLGGEAGGGKSAALLMDACLRLPQKGYSALIIRRTYAQLSAPGAIMREALEWFQDDPDFHWDRIDKVLTYKPSKSYIQFRHLLHDDSHFNLQGAQPKAIYLDEAGQIPEHQIRYLKSRLRKIGRGEAASLNDEGTGPLASLARASANAIPIKFRMSANPDGISFDYLRDEYVHGDLKYLHSIAADNPALDVTDYKARLKEALTEQDYAKYGLGSWDVILGQRFFASGSLLWLGADAIEELDIWRTVRTWDTAATLDGDFFASMKLGICEAGTVILDITREKVTAGEIQGRIEEVAENDGPSVLIREEQEPGSSGLEVITNRRKALSNFNYVGVRSTGSKVDRAKPASVAMSKGKIIMGIGREHAHAKAFVRELDMFATKDQRNDDMVDCLSLGYNHLNRGRIRAL